MRRSAKSRNPFQSVEKTVCFNEEIFLEVTRRGLRLNGETRIVRPPAGSRVLGLAGNSGGKARKSESRKEVGKVSLVQGEKQRLSLHRVPPLGWRARPRF